MTFNTGKCALSLYAIGRLSVGLSRVDQSKTVEIRIMKFSPYGSPIPLVFADCRVSFIP